LLGYGRIFITMRLKKLKPSQLNSLPATAGVYIFFNAKKSPLYIGKTVNLRERVKTHFFQPNYKDNLFIKEIRKIGYIPLKSDIEALILESRMIKKFQPRFNILFRDDKKYFYVGITKPARQLPDGSRPTSPASELAGGRARRLAGGEEWPMVFITHQPDLKTYKLKNLKTEYIGPFTDGGALKEALKTIRKIFPYRTCEVLSKRPCLWYQLDRCPAPCLIEREAKIRKIFKKETNLRKKDYKNDIKKIKLILTGERKRLTSNLTSEMRKMAQSEEFEKATKIRDRIESLKKIFSHREILVEIPQKEKENVGLLLKEILHLSQIPKRIEGYDISNIKNLGMVGSMVVFKLSRFCQEKERKYCEYKYVPEKSQYRKFKIKQVLKQNDIACLKEVLRRRLSHQEWGLPDLIYVDGGKSQLNAVKKIVMKFQRAKFVKPIPIISLAKKRNLLYNIFLKNPLSLDKLPREVKMTILHLKDESHRFSISYHKTLRAKLFFLSAKKKSKVSNL